MVNWIELRIDNDKTDGNNVMMVFDENNFFFLIFSIRCVDRQYQTHKLLL